MTAFSKGEFNPNQGTSVGAATTTFSSSDETVGPITVWDTAGQEHFRSIAALYYREAELVLLVFAVNAPDSFNSLTSWITTVTESSAHPPSFLIVGNKIDVRSDPGWTCVSAADARAFAENQNTIYMEVSAKSGQGVSDLLYQASEIAYSKSRKTEETQPVDPEGNDQSHRKSCMGC
jgi:small GTP-binding protein